MTLNELILQAQEIAKNNPELGDREVAVTGMYGSHDFDLEFKIDKLHPTFDSAKRLLIVTSLNTG